MNRVQNKKYWQIKFGIKIIDDHDKLDIKQFLWLIKKRT